MRPGKGRVHAARGEAEVGDGPRVPLLHIVVLEHPVSVSWVEAGLRLAAPGAPALSPAPGPPHHGAC